jgi:hypothetical protein
LNSRLKTEQRPPTAQLAAANAHASHASFSGCALHDAARAAVEEIQIAAAMAQTTVAVENKLAHL